MIILINFFIFLITTILVKLFSVAAQNTRLLDKPNERTMHASPIVRGGGLIFIGVWLCAIAIIPAMTAYSIGEYWILLSSVLLLAGISFLDDLYHLSIKPRLMIHCLVALIVAIFIIPIKLDFLFFSLNNQYLVMGFIFITVIWAINHFNFMDGLDGFSSLQGIFLLGTYGLIFGELGAIPYECLCLILMAALMAFLMFNFPPAKIFMGDVGSASLGLITFLMAVLAQKNYEIPILYWFMFNGLFLFDSTVTLLRRMLKRQKWHDPHKKHAYQRLKQKDISTHIILSCQCLINAMIIALVFITQRYPSYAIILVFIEIVFLSAIYYVIEKIYPMD